MARLHRSEPEGHALPGDPEREGRCHAAPAEMGAARDRQPGMTDDDYIVARLFAELAEPEAADPVVEAPAIRSRAVRDAHRAGMVERDRTARLQRDLAAMAAEDPDRLEWPDWWFQPVTSIVHRHVRNLWIAVLAQVIRDAANTGPYVRREREQALAWLNGHASDRRFVCGLIGRDPDEFSRAALAYLENGDTHHARRTRHLSAEKPHDPPAQPAPER
ncbi:hypothetical protein EMVG_00040 [Emiliania huxleyi virus PS401]|nr:hypothetical protein EMVG_00040 [Emiliania huxleyi virus PS401]